MGLPKKRGELTGSVDGETWALYVEETDSVHQLNESARAIWELCDGSTSPSEMAAAIAEVTNLDHEESTRQVAETLKALGDLRLVDY